MHLVERHCGAGCQFSWNGPRSGFHGSRQGTMMGKSEEQFPQKTCLSANCRSSVGRLLTVCQPTDFG